MTSSRVIAVDERGVELEADGADDIPGLGAGHERERIAMSTVLWGAGVRANSLGSALGVPIDRQVRVIVERLLAAWSSFFVHLVYLIGFR